MIDWDIVGLGLGAPSGYSNIFDLTVCSAWLKHCASCFPPSLPPPVGAPPGFSNIRFWSYIAWNISSTHLPSKRAKEGDSGYQVDLCMEVDILSRNVYWRTTMGCVMGHLIKELAPDFRLSLHATSFGWGFWPLKTVACWHKRIHGANSFSWCRPIIVCQYTFFD